MDFIKVNDYDNFTFQTSVIQSMHFEENASAEDCQTPTTEDTKTVYNESLYIFKPGMVPPYRQMFYQVRNYLKIFSYLQYSAILFFYKYKILLLLNENVLLIFSIVIYTFLKFKNF